MRKKDLYDENGYLNTPYLYNLPYPFIFIVGGRGIGKTYGVEKYLVTNGIKQIFLRRTQTQCDTVLKSEELSPFKSLNRDLNLDITPKSAVKNVYKLVDNDTEEVIGYAGGLSTFSNLRGFDATDVQCIFLDEFIPQITEKAIRGEADAFLNMVETISRNRELKGEQPVKVFCCANSTDAANPIFIELGIVSLVMRLQQKKEFFYADEKRGFCIILPKDSPITEQKRNTALYKLTEGTAFYASALDNEFVYNVPTNIRSRPLQEYKPMVQVGEVCIYKHKSKKLLYVSEHKSGTAEKYGASFKELLIFQRRYSKLRSYLYANLIEYENYTCEVLLDKYMEVVL